MNKHLFLIIGLLILALVNYDIYSKEQLLREGRTLLLELAPVDPRSLMQGDYMALNYKISQEWQKLRPYNPPDQGYLVLVLDEDNIGQLQGLDRGNLLEQNQLRIHYRVRKDRLLIGSNAFFFEEGSAERYSQAAYGELRVNESGDSLLVALRDKDLQLLGETTEDNTLNPAGE